MVSRFFKVKSFPVILLFVFLYSCSKQTSTLLPTVSRPTLSNPTVSYTPTYKNIPTKTKNLGESTDLYIRTNTPSPTVKFLALTSKDILNSIKDENYQNLCEYGPFPPYPEWSPDKHWLVVNCELNVILKFIDSITGSVHQIDVNSIYPLELSPDLGTYNYMVADLWSSDGRFIFFRPYVCCADGPMGTMGQVVSLYRLDLTSGDLWVILSPSSTDWVNYSYAFSPNENFIAYVSPSENNVLHILNLKTKEDVKKVINDEKDLFLLNPKWTDDGQEIVIAQLDNYSDKSSLFLLNVQDLSVDRLIENDPRSFLPDGNPTSGLKNNILRLYSLTELFIWEFNIRTKSLVQIPNP